MNDSSWVFAIEEDKLIEDGMFVIFPKGIPIIFIKKESEIYAVSNKCAHMACPLSVYPVKIDGDTIKIDIKTC